MTNIFDVTEGDYVVADGDSSFCTMSIAKVSKIISKFDEDTGELYEVIILGSDWYDGRTGLSWKDSTNMYYIAEKSSFERYMEYLKQQ